MKIVRRILKYFIVAVVVVLVADATVIIFFSIYRPPVKHADDIVILGSAINTPSLYNRSIAGLKLYQDGLAPKLVLSGGQDYTGAETEAVYMEKIILANASSSVPVIMEGQSHSTYDNFKNTKEKIGASKNIIVVSDSFHLARGVLMAEREGFHVVYWSSPPSYYYSKKELLYYYTREAFAMMDYIPKFIFG